MHQSINVVKILAFHPAISMTMLTALLKKQSADLICAKS